MNLLNIRKVGYGVRSIDELRAPGAALNPSRPSLLRRAIRSAAFLMTCVSTPGQRRARSRRQR